MDIQDLRNNADDSQILDELIAYAGSAYINGFVEHCAQAWDITEEGYLCSECIQSLIYDDRTWIDFYATSEAESDCMLEQQDQDEIDFLDEAIHFHLDGAIKKGDHHCDCCGKEDIDLTRVIKEYY